MTVPQAQHSLPPMDEALSDLAGLIDDIAAYCDARGIAESTFGRLCLNNNHLVPRMRKGKTITVASYKRIRQYMADNPPPARESSAA